LGAKANLTVHYYFLNGLDYGCQGDNGNACGNQCLNSGKYCAVDPEHDLNMGVSGADIVRENLRQICIFWQSSGAGKGAELWFSYVGLFDVNCRTQFNDACANLQMQTVGINGAQVSACMNDHGGLGPSAGENSVIEAEIATRADQGVYLLPTIIINNVPYRGGLECNEASTSKCGVLAAICSGYAPGTEPDVCKGSDGCKPGEKRDACGNCGGDGSFDSCGQCLPANHPDRRSDSKKCHEVYTSTQPKMSAWKVIAIVCTVVFFAGAGFVYYTRRSQAHMRRELAEIMEQYAPLTDADLDDEPTSASRVRTMK